MWFTPYSDPTLGIYYHGRTLLANDLNFSTIKSCSILEGQITLDKLILSKTLGGDRVYYSGKEPRIFRKGYHVLKITGSNGSIAFPFNDEKYYEYFIDLKHKWGLNSHTLDSQSFTLKELAYEYYNSQLILDNNLNYFFKNEKIFQNDTSNFQLMRKYIIFLDTLFIKLNYRKRISIDEFENFLEEYKLIEQDSVRMEQVTQRIEKRISARESERANFKFIYYYSKKNIIEIQLDFLRTQYLVSSEFL